MRRLLTLADRLDDVVRFFGKLGGWMILPLLAIVVFDVVTRKWKWLQYSIIDSPLYAFLSPSHLQDMEWHLHTVLFLLAAGYAYANNAHVRVDLVRERLTDRRQAWIELLGILLFMLPFLALLLHHAWGFVEVSYRTDEVSMALTGLSHRWIIKSFMLIGLVLALIAGLATLIRHSVFLFGPAAMRGAVRMNTLSSAGSEFLPTAGEPAADVPRRG